MGRAAQKQNFKNGGILTTNKERGGFTVNTTFKKICTAGLLGVIVWLCVLFMIYTGVAIIAWLMIGLFLFGLCYLWNKYAKPIMASGEEHKTSTSMAGKRQ